MNKRLEKELIEIVQRLVKSQKKKTVHSKSYCKDKDMRNFVRQREEDFRNDFNEFLEKQNFKK